VLIFTYEVDTMSLNLHEACDGVVLSGSGQIWGQKSQAYERYLRVSHFKAQFRQQPDNNDLPLGVPSIPLI
jgi:hypothetical protein